MFHIDEGRWGERIGSVYETGVVIKKALWSGTEMRWVDRYDRQREVDRCRQIDG